MFNFPKCPKCGNILPIATGVCAICPISPPPGQDDQSACLAASAEVDQGEGTQRELSDEELANVLACALRVVELRAVRRLVGVDEFKRRGLSTDLRLSERLVLIHADWLMEQGA